MRVPRDEFRRVIPNTGVCLHSRNFAEWLGQHRYAHYIYELMTSNDYKHLFCISRYTDEFSGK